MRKNKEYSIAIDTTIPYLKSQGIITNVRRSCGKDIDAACGQLAIKDKKEEESEA